MGEYNRFRKSVQETAARRDVLSHAGVAGSLGLDRFGTQAQPEQAENEREKTKQHKTTPCP